MRKAWLMVAACALAAGATAGLRGRKQRKAAHVRVRSASAGSAEGSCR